MQKATPSDCLIEGFTFVESPVSNSPIVPKAIFLEVMDAYVLLA